MQIQQADSGWVLESEQYVGRPLSEVFDFFSQAENLQELTPPWLHFQVRTPLPIEMRQGCLIDYRIRLRMIPMLWRSEITVWEPPYRFVDEQRRGPYRRWVHEHAFESQGEGTLVRDRIEYDVPGGRIVHWLCVRRDIERIFRYRREKLAAIFGPTGEQVSAIR